MTNCATLLLRPIIPLWLLALCVLAFAGAAWLTYVKCQLSRRRHLVLWGVRVAAILLLAWLLMQAQERTERTEHEPAVLAVGLDVSASMTEKLGDNEYSRAERALEIVGAEGFKKFADKFRYLYFEVGRETQELSGDVSGVHFDAPRSNLSAGINSIARRLRAENVAGLVLLTDGLDQAGDALTPESQALSIYAVELEAPFEALTAALRDTYIDDVSYPDVVMLNWDASIDLLVRRRHGGTESCSVHLYQEGTRIRSSVARFDGEDRFARVSFEIKPEKLGRIYYYVEVTPDGDGLPENNMREFMLEVIDPENRVLYLEGLPRWEFKFLKRALLTEKTFQLSAFVQGAAGSFVSFSEDNTVTTLDLPSMSVEELARYRVIILGDIAASVFRPEDFQNIRRFVENGGGLLLIGAAKAYGVEGWASSLVMRELLPAVPEPGARMSEGHLAVDFTPVGRTHPAVRSLAYFQSIPPVLSVWRPVRVGELSSSLIVTADNSPVVVVRRYGQGRVAMVLSDSLWRLQLGGASEVDKSFYNTLITQMVHWLAPSEKDFSSSGLLQVVTAGSEFELRERVTIGAVYGEGMAGSDSLTCAVVTPDGRKLSLPMAAAELGSEVGLVKAIAGYSCEFTPHLPGQYTVSVADSRGNQSASERILVKRADRELSGKAIDRAFLGRIAQETGGKFLDWDDRAALFDLIKEQSRTIQIVEEAPIWNHPAWYVILVALFIVEWWLRRRSDLV